MTRRKDGPEICLTCGESHRRGPGYMASHEAWLSWRGKIAESNRRRRGAKRQPPSLETRAKLAAAGRRRIVSDQTREKIIAALRARPPISDATRAKLSENTRRLWQDPAFVRKNRRPRVTTIEKVVYGWLNEIGIRFHREQPMIGGVVDIYCPDIALGIEVDGDYWHPEGNARDHTKDYLRGLAAIRCIRLREVDIKSGAARDQLLQAIDEQRDLVAELAAIRAGTWAPA